MFPGALQIFKNALQSGDQESTKKFIRDLNIAWASKSVEVDLATLSKDNLSTSLVPEDIYSQPQAGIPVAVQATGNGNCLYNSASLILCGNEQRSHYLREQNYQRREAGTNNFVRSGLERTIWPLVHAWLLEGFVQVSL